MKKSLFVIAVLVCVLAMSSSVMATDEISVVLDGEKLAFDVAPQNINSRVLLPLRAIFEAMGAEVVWVDETKTVTATKDDTVVVLVIDDPKPTINGVVKEIDQPGIIVDGRTLAPLRFVAEAFGGTVDWDGATQTATITSGKAAEEPAKEEPAEEVSPTDAELEAAYKKAVEAYGWFYGATMPVDKDATKEDNGKTYSKVNHATIKTLADLESYLKTIFTVELVAKIMADNDRYRDFEGALYVIPAEASVNPLKAGQEVEITRESATKIVCKVTVDILEDADSEEVVDTEAFIFNYFLVGEVWLFSTFHLVDQ